MAKLNLDSEKFENSIGELKKAANENVIANMTAVAAALRNTDDSNPLIGQSLENCKKFQFQYNVCLEGIESFIGEMDKVYEISEYMQKKANVGTVSGRDTGFSTEKIDTGKVLF